jgi:hypothetical protein
MKNQSRDFATMSDDERRKYALENPTDAEATELDFDDPRDPDRMGRDYQNPEEEYADPERRDGAAAQLDDEAHEENVRRSTDRSNG